MVNRAKVSIEHFYGPTNGGQLQKHIYEHDLTLLQLFLSLKSLKLKGRNITQQAERILMNVECPPSPFLMWCTWMTWMTWVAARQRDETNADCQLHQSPPSICGCHWCRCTRALSHTFPAQPSPSPPTTPLPPPNPPIPGIVYLPTLFHLAIQLNLGDTLLSVGVQNCRKCRREETRPRKQCNSYIFYFCFLDKLSAEAIRYHLLPIVLGLAMFEYELLKLVRSRWRLLKQLVLAFWKSWRSWNNSFLQRSFLQVQVAPIQ